MTRARRNRGRTLVALLAASFALAASGGAQDRPVAENLDLLGTWHVLVHYTDDNSSHPDQLRWHDRVWIFAHENGKLVWTEYPIAVFGDESGRFEGLGTNRARRVVGGWVPNELQAANIRLGLRTNSRGMKTKKLRGSDSKGWTTTSRVRAASSSVITYQEIWTVAFAGSLPDFRQEDVMGAARAENLEGVTRYALHTREAGGVFEGSYERDGTRHGKVWLRRAGDRLRLQDKDPNERLRELLRLQAETFEPEDGSDPPPAAEPDLELIPGRGEAEDD